MTRHRPDRAAGKRGSRCAVMLAAAVLLTTPASAQSGGDGFLFSQPSGTVTFRTGFDHARAGSELFAFTTDRLTVDRGDFSGGTIAGDVSIRLSGRTDVMISVAHSQAQSRSEFRHWLDNAGLPIEQTTTFRRVPLTGSLRAYLVQPGHTIGHFAWVPARFSPYIGAGGGVMWYRFAQAGDFIDFNTTRVFPDAFSSSGWTPTVHGIGGVDISLHPRFALTTEARYEWGRAELSSDFAGFDRLDLSGFTVTTGISIRY
ncbi:MAG: hypothetical protein ABI868_03425 [Acidobacteriota bacterium]